MVDSSPESLPLLFSPSSLFFFNCRSIILLYFFSVCFESSSSPNTVAPVEKFCVLMETFFPPRLFSRSLSFSLRCYLLDEIDDIFHIILFCVRLLRSSLDRRMRLRVSSIFLNLLLISCNLFLIKFHTYFPTKVYQVCRLKSSPIFFFF